MKAENTSSQLIQSVGMPVVVLGMLTFAFLKDVAPRTDASAGQAGVRQLIEQPAHRFSNPPLLVATSGTEPVYIYRSDGLYTLIDQTIILEKAVIATDNACDLQILDGNGNLLAPVEVLSGSIQIDFGGIVAENGVTFRNTSFWQYISTEFQFAIYYRLE